MFEQLKKKLTISSEQVQPSQTEANIRVVGDRASGKTTYMAALACYPNAASNTPVQAVTPDNKEGEELIAKAQNILEQGLELEPTDLSANASQIEGYGLSIIVQGNNGSLLRLSVNCKDYAGEFFTDLIYQTNSEQLHNYLQDCVPATGLMFLVDGTAYRNDSEYANGLEKFLVALSREDSTTTKRRIALVLTKCEQPELWVNRHKPRDVASARFPKLYGKLQSWQQSRAGSVEYFITSALGTLGSRFPEPNSKPLSRGRSGMRSVLKEPKLWRPFGLIAPIYWLCTGERHKQLDKE